jgi:hypothetical protein
MIELKPLDVAYKFCSYVQRECTGSRNEFADLLGITPCWVSVYKRKIEQLYKVEINYSRRRQTYYVQENDVLNYPPLI